MLGGVPEWNPGPSATLGLLPKARGLHGPLPASPLLEGLAKAPKALECPPSVAGRGSGRSCFLGCGAFAPLPPSSALTVARGQLPAFPFLFSLGELIALRTPCAGTALFLRLRRHLRESSFQLPEWQPVDATPSQSAPVRWGTPPPRWEGCHLLSSCLRGWQPQGMTWNLLSVGFPKLLMNNKPRGFKDTRMS